MHQIGLMKESQKLNTFKTKIKQMKHIVVNAIHIFHCRLILDVLFIQFLNLLFILLITFYTYFISLALISHIAINLG